MGRHINPNPLVSVIMPTCDDYALLLRNLDIVAKQIYKPFEILVGDDSHPEFRDNHKTLRAEVEKRARIFYTARFDEHGKKIYGLAAARNQCIVESQGEVLVFLDDRIAMTNPENIHLFVNELLNKEKIWCFGNKGKEQIAFVENFSAVRRDKCIDAGMFCERIDKYGAMTREVIARYTHQGFTFKYIPEATATWLVSSPDRERKTAEAAEMREFLVKLGYAKPKVKPEDQLNTLNNDV